MSWPTYLHCTCFSIDKWVVFLKLNIQRSHCSCKVKSDNTLILHVVDQKEGLFACTVALNCQNATPNACYGCEKCTKKKMEPDSKKFGDKHFGLRVQWHLLLPKDDFFFVSKYFFLWCLKCSTECGVELHTHKLLSSVSPTLFRFFFRREGRMTIKSVVACFCQCRPLKY